MAKITIEQQALREILEVEVVKSLKPEDQNDKDNVVLSVFCMHPSDWKSQQYDEFIRLSRQHARYDALRKKEGENSTGVKKLESSMRSENHYKVFGEAALVEEKDRIAWELLNMANKNLVISTFSKWVKGDADTQQK